MYTIRVPFAEEGVQREDLADAIIEAKRMAAEQLPAQAKRYPDSPAVPWAVTADFNRSRVAAQGAVLPDHIKAVNPGETHALKTVNPETVLSNDPGDTGA